MTPFLDFTSISRTTITITKILSCTRIRIRNFINAIGYFIYNEWVGSYFLCWLLCVLFFSLFLCVVFNMYTLLRSHKQITEMFRYYEYFLEQQKHLLQVPRFSRYLHKKTENFLRYLQMLGMWYILRCDGSSLAQLGSFWNIFGELLRKRGIVNFFISYGRYIWFLLIQSEQKLQITSYI